MVDTLLVHHPDYLGQFRPDGRLAARKLDGVPGDGPLRLQGPAISLTWSIVGSYTYAPSRPFFT